MGNRATPESLWPPLYMLAFIDEFGPLYALYTLWFNDNGITIGQISTVFVIWAAVEIALEIPSGALADRVDRRKLVAVAFILRAIGIAVWMVSPNYAGVVAGATLWGMHSSLASGAWQALIYDELSAVGKAYRYGVVMARVGQFSNLGIAAGTIIATVALRFGVTIEALGWATVAVHAASIALVLSLPDVRWVTSDGEQESASSSYQAWWATLRAGVKDARHIPLVGRLIILGAVLEGLFIFDEYVPLLARGRGAADALVPVLVLIVWVGLLLGGEIVARRPRIAGPTLGLGLIGGALAMIVAVQTPWVWMLALFGVGYATLESIWVVSDARLQERATPATRATVTSVRSFFSGIVAALAFAMVGFFADGDDPSRGLTVGLGVLILTGIAALRWLPPPQQIERLP